MFSYVCVIGGWYDEREVLYASWFAVTSMTWNSSPTASADAGTLNHSHRRSTLARGPANTDTTAIAATTRNPSRSRPASSTAPSPSRPARTSHHAGCNVL